MTGALIFNLVVLGILGFLFFRDPGKAKRSLEIAFKSFFKIMPLLLIVVILMAFLQDIFARQVASGLLVAFSGIQGYIMASLAGAVVHVPHFVAFPIAGELLKGGFDPGIVGAFVTSLVMVHTFSIPIEIKEMGMRFALTRNLLALCCSVMIGILIGVVY